jgi:uncharacterized protein (TIRG00374 family)
VRPAAVLGTHLAVGAGVLGWLLHRHGEAAFALLATRARPAVLAAFAAVVAAAFLLFALRWRILLAGLGVPRSLRRLTAYRAAGQSLSSLVPSAQLGGDPLRAFLLVRDRVPAAAAITSVAVDRTLEMSASVPFVLLYAGLLVRRGVPALEGTVVTVSLGAVALAVGLAVAVRRLRRGAGLVTAVARATGIDRLRLVRDRIAVLAAADGEAARLVAERGRLARAFGVGAVVNALVLVEYHLLLDAFGLPAGPLAVVAAVFAMGAARSLPVPAALGTLEGAELWLFGMLGHPPEVGLAVGLAVRLRELVWVLPGLLYLLVRGLDPRRLAD